MKFFLVFVLTLLSVTLVEARLTTPTVIATADKTEIVTKSKQATTQYPLKNATLFVDLATWQVSLDSNSNEAIDKQFEHVDGNARGMALSFREFVPIDEFITNFVEGMKADAPETKLVDRRTVTVNGINMEEVTIDMVTPQAPIRYFGYVYSGAKGVCLTLALCHRDLFTELRPALESYAAGLVVASQPSATKPKKK